MSTNLDVSSSVAAIEEMARQVEEMIALMREGRGGGWKAHQRAAVDAVLASSPELPGKPRQIRKALLERLRIRRDNKGT